MPAYFRFSAVFYKLFETPSPQRVLRFFAAINNSGDFRVIENRPWGPFSLFLRFSRRPG
jgi:hypothetical protein